MLKDAQRDRAFVLAARLLGLEVAVPDSLAGAADLDEYCRNVKQVARELGLEIIELSAYDQTIGSPGPRIVLCRNGDVHVFAHGRNRQLVTVNDDLSPGASEPASQADFQVERVLLVQRRAEKQRHAAAQSLLGLIKLACQERGVPRDVLLSSVIVQLFALSTPIFFQVVFDRVLPTGSTDALHLLGIVFVSMLAIEAVISVAREGISSALANKVTRSLASVARRKLLALPSSIARGMGKQRFNQLENDISVIHRFLSGSSFLLVVDGFFVVLMFSILMFYSVPLASLVLGLVLILATASLFSVKRYRLLAIEREQVVRQGGEYRDEFERNFQTIRDNALDAKLYQHWDMNARQAMQHDDRIRQVTGRIQQAAQFVVKALGVVVLWVGVVQVFEGALTAGALIAFNILAMRAVSPFVRLPQVLAEYSAASQSFLRVQRLLHLPDEMMTVSRGIRLRKFVPEFSVNAVRFRYEGVVEPVLDRCSWTLKANEHVAIVGHSGSGKTTFARLLVASEAPESGDVIVSGRPIKEFDCYWLRRRVGYAGRDSGLFEGSIATNITFDDSGMHADRYQAVARATGLDSEIAKLESGYGHSVSSGGGNLPLHLKRLIVITRALYTEPDAMILDDIFDGMTDGQAASLLQRLRKVLTGRTLVVLDRDTRNAEHLDRGWMLRDGRLIPLGSRVATSTVAVGNAKKPTFDWPSERGT